MKKLNLPFFIVTVLSILYACTNSEESGPVTPQVRNTAAVTSIELVDAGNSGTTSDLAIKYEGPSSTTGIAELRAFIVSGSTAQISAEEALQYSGELYVSIDPTSEVLGVGIKLGALKSDVAGNEITFPGSYFVGVLSVPTNENFRASIAFSSSATSVKVSNEVVAYTNEITIGHEDNPYSAGAGAGGMVIDKEGNIYMGDVQFPFPSVIGDPLNTTNVIKISPSKSISIYSTNHQQPFGNYIAEDGSIYQSSHTDGKVWKISPNGDRRTQLDTGIKLIHPDGITEDDEGNLYIADCGAHRILKVNPNGDAFPFPAMGRCPKGIVFANGYFYISYNNETGMIRRMDKQGNFEEIGAIPVYMPEDFPITRQLYQLWLGYLAYHNDELFIAGTSTHRIYKMSLDGEVSVFAGTGEKGLKGGDALEAKLNRPMDIIVSNDGNSFFINCSTDMWNSHITYLFPAKIWEIRLLE